MQNKECALSGTSKTTEKESGGHNTMICKKIDISVDSYQETAALYTYFFGQLSGDDSGQKTSARSDLPGRRL